MTTDLKTQIRGYFDEIDPPFEPDELMAHPAAGRISDGRANRLRWRRYPGWAYAAATAAIVLLVVAGSVWLSGFLGKETPPVITQPTTPPTSIPETTDDPIAAPTSDLINQVADLALAPDGTLWIATRGGVVEWPVGASSPVVYGEEDGLPAAVVNRIVVATDGTVWAAGNDWVAYYDQMWQSVAVEDLSRWTMVADPRGGVWTTANSSEGDEVLLHVDRHGTEPISLPEEGMGWSAGLDIAVDAAGRVFAVDIADTQVIFVYDGGTWRELATEAPLFEDVPRYPPGDPEAPHYMVTSIEVGPDGTVWVSTQGDSDPEPEGTPAPGVASLSGQTWTIHTTSDGLASNAGVVTIGKDGTVWVIHRDAISRREGEAWVIHDVAGSPRNAVGAGDGTLWLGTDNGIVHLDGTTTTASTVPREMAPAVLPFRLESAAPAGPPFDAGSFGLVSWRRFNVPTGRSLARGTDTAHGFAAIGDGPIVRSSAEGVSWAPSEPPIEARHLVASGEELYVLGEGVARLAWMGTTWEIVDEFSVPDPGPEIRSEGGYPDFIEHIAFGDGVTVITARSRVFFSTDGHTFVPALRGPDPGLLAGAGEPDSPNYGYAGGCEPSWSGGWDGEGSIGPVFVTGSGFVAFTPAHPNDWNNSHLCRPVVWTSNDGSTWDLHSGESPFGPDGLVYAMAERDGRLVAVGTRDDEGARWDDGGVLWVSEDGISWNEIPAERIKGSIASAPWAIAAGEAGWVALYGEAGTYEEVRAIYSLDGLEWVVDTEPIPDLWWAFGTPDVAVGKDRILVTYYMDSVYIGEITR